MKRLIAQLLALLLTMNQALASEVFSIEPCRNPERARSIFWLPLASFAVPSLDQWIERQYAAGGVYAGMAGLGLGLQMSQLDRIHRHDLNSQDFQNYREAERIFAYGAQLYMFAGEMSSFHAFRTAVESRRAAGEFAFITNKDTPGDLFLAPFEFSQLTRPTTFIPLGLLAALGAISVTQRRSHFNLGDAAFTAGTSYNAGVGEEALFRGFMMPLLREKASNDFWSNTLTALAFGAAHLSSSNRLPWPQTALGWYFGWLTQRHEWSLRQAIFIHAWWDVLAIGVSLAQSNQVERTIPLPGLTLSF